jgi:hypothetical protein
MSHRRPGGFTLVETLIALTLAAAVTGLALDLLRSQQRLTRIAVAGVEAQLTLHSALTFVVHELRPLGAGGGGSDILALDTDALTYRATRGFALACGVTPDGFQVRLPDRYGIRLPVPGRDSLLVFRAGDTATTGDDGWVALPLQGFRQEVGCGGIPVWGVQVGWGTSGPSQAFAPPLPIRIYEVVQLRAYRQGGQTWLGARSVSAGETIQPVLGPLATDGFRLEFFAADGTPAADPAAVRSVGVLLRGAGDGFSTGDSLSTRVHLRNAGRP